MNLDQLIINFNKCLKTIEEYGFYPEINGLKEYIEYWKEIIEPIYITISIPYNYDRYNFILNDIIIPLSKKNNLPIALNFGNKNTDNLNSKTINNNLLMIQYIKYLCCNNPSCKFLVTFKFPISNYILFELSNKFKNLYIYDCNLYLTKPYLLEQILNKKIEILGTKFNIHINDINYLEQIIYKSYNLRESIKNTLLKKYIELDNIGWTITNEEVKKDLKYILRGSFEEFIKN